MKRLLIVIMICFSLAGAAAATDIQSSQAELFGTDRLWDGLDERTSELMAQFAPTVQADLGAGVSAILSDAVRQSGGTLRATVSIMLRILAIAILCRFVGTLGDAKAAFAAGLAATMAITVSCAADLRSMIGLGQTTMEDIGSFTTLLLPVLTAAATASGAFTSAAAIYGVTALFCDILVRVCRYLLLPLVYAFLALGVADSALGQSRLGKLRELLGWIVKSMLKTVLYLFTGFLAATGVISGTADAAALKAARLTISGMVPVVGGIVSDASESLLTSAGVLKSAIGTFGMLAVLAMFLLPFLQMGISYLGFKLTSALCGVLDSGQDKLLDTLTASMGLLLAMVGSCTAMSLISCCCLVKVSFA